MDSVSAFLAPSQADPDRLYWDEWVGKGLGGGSSRMVRSGSWETDYGEGTDGTMILPFILLMP